MSRATMEAEQKILIETLLRELILLANHVGEAVDQAKLFKVNCREMGKRVYELFLVLKSLLRVITSDPILLYLIPIHRVISEVYRILGEALTLACKCRRKTIFCRLFTDTPTNSTFHNLFHLLDTSIDNMNRFVIIYNPDFNSAFDEIFLSLPQILSNDSSILSTWSCMFAENITWGLATMLTSTDNVMIVEGLMICLAKLVREEHGGFQCNCLMTILEITAAAESNLDVRCKAFKTKSPGSRALVEQLLRVIKESEDPTLQVLAIKSIGSLARIFYERENHHAIDVLASQLGNEHQEVAKEAIVALIKFASKDNYLCKAHSKRMIEFNAVPPLVKLLIRDAEMTQQQSGLVLMCYLTLNADYNRAMEQAGVLTAVQQLLTRKSGCRTVASQHPELTVLVAEALQNLTLYYKY